MNIVVLERHSVGEDVSVDEFNKLGNVTIYNNTVTPDEVIERIAKAQVVVANKAPLNENTLKNANELKLICELATGFDNVDVDYCKQKGILVCNVVDYSTDAVAQHTFALLFYVLEKLRHYDDYVKSGEYASQSRFSNFDKPFFELAGKTWGIIGMGHIGKKVAKIANAFGCRVITYSVTGKAESGSVEDSQTGDKYEYVTFEELLKQSDIISLHCPLSDLTRGIMNYEAFKKMKDTAILINVARGPVVVDADLKQALDEKLIMAAGLDVTGTEPMRDENPLSKFTDSDRLIITPHLAWASIEARRRCVTQTAKNIEAYQKGERRNVVWE